MSLCTYIFRLYQGGVVSEVKNVGVLYWLDRKNGGQKKIRPHPKQSKTEQKIWMDGLITENR